MELSTLKKYISIACLISALVAAMILFYMVFLKPEKTSPVTFTEQEILEQSEGREYCIKKEGISYIFRPDGTLAVSGTGSTTSFETVEDAQMYFLRELYKTYAGAYPESTAQLLPFRQLLDRVTEIEVMEGITELGDCSFSPFYYVETVSLPETLKRAGNYALLGAGQYAEGELILFGSSESEAEYSELSLRTNPASSEVTYAAGSALKGEDLQSRPEEEQGTIPEEELLVASIDMGENITYRLYENGVLYITGYGSTHDFMHFSEMEQHVTEELHLVSKLEAETMWFGKVVEIIIGDSVERIGNNALAQYRNVLAVYGGELKELGNRAFLNLGADTATDTIWNIDFEYATVAEDSFKHCKNIPDTETEEE